MKTYILKPDRTELNSLTLYLLRPGRDEERLQLCRWQGKRDGVDIYRNPRDTSGQWKPLSDLLQDLTQIYDAPIQVQA